MNSLIRAAFAVALLAPLPALAATYDLVIDRTDVQIEGQARRVFSINGQIAGPTLRWTEGEEVTINVINRLKEETSIHWHGVLVPNGLILLPADLSQEKKAPLVLTTLDTLTTRLRRFRGRDAHC